MDIMKLDYAALFGGSREATILLSGKEEIYRNAAAETLLQHQKLGTLTEELPALPAAFTCTLGPLTLNARTEALGELTILRLSRDKMQSTVPTALVSELRDRLMSLQLSMERLTDTLEEADNDLYGTSLRRSLYALFYLVERLGDSCQLAEGGLSCFPQRLNLLQLYKDMLFSLKLLLPKRMPELSIQGDEDCIVEADPVRLEELLLYLLNNAFRHTPREGSVSVRLKKEKGSVRIIVEDNGEGMDSAVLATLFSEESRGWQSGHPALGLELVRGIAEAHGGRLLIESRSDRGTRALVSLPLAEDQTSPVSECIPPEGIHLIQRIMADLLELNAYRAVFDD